MVEPTYFYRNCAIVFGNLKDDYYYLSSRLYAAIELVFCYALYLSFAMLYFRRILPLVEFQSVRLLKVIVSTKLIFWA